MFTLYMNLDSNQFSTVRLSLLQFGAALSSVKAVVKTEGHEVIEL